MILHKDFLGGNIKVIEQKGNTFILENEIRDTTEDWFYWAFCVEGAENRTITFSFQQQFRVGYWGPAVSYDLVNWHWLGSADGESFTYHFKEDESKVYFAHDMLYHPDRFFKFAAEKNLNVTKLCDGYKGSQIPCVELGSGDKTMILTARHHACEATGSYVLEGVLDELVQNPIEGYKVFCVPFVDYEGVVRGDQGKRRAPHDHNVDYEFDKPAIYPEIAAIRKYADDNKCHLGFDFHSPWHMWNSNDHVFLVLNEKSDQLNVFGDILESCITENSMKYFCKNNFPFMYDWNMGKRMGFSRHMAARPENDIACTLETTYFGLSDNVVSQDKMVELGHCFAKAVKKYVETVQKI